MVDRGDHIDRRVLDVQVVLSRDPGNQPCPSSHRVGFIRVPRIAIVHPPEVNFARGGETNLALSAIGGGPLDRVFVRGWVLSALEIVATEWRVA